MLIILKTISLHWFDIEIKIKKKVDIIIILFIRA